MIRSLNLFIDHIGYGMKLLNITFASLVIYPIIVLAYDGCPGNLIPNQGRCESYNDVINQVAFPFNSSVNVAPRVVSNPQNPLIIQGIPETFNFSSLEGPWVVRVPTAVRADFFTNWPYIEAPVNITMFGKLPFGGRPESAPGISCDTTIVSSVEADIECR